MRAVKMATSVEGIPAYRDYTSELSPELRLVRM